MNAAKKARMSTAKTPTTSDLDMFVAAKIRSERMARGWTIDVLAKKADVGKGTISMVENNECSVSVRILDCILRALSLSLGFHSTAGEVSSVWVELHPAAIEKLKELAAQGLHGVGASGVAQRMIEDGIRREMGACS